MASESPLLWYIIHTCVVVHYTHLCCGTLYTPVLWYIIQTCVMVHYTHLCCGTFYTPVFLYITHTCAMVHYTHLCCVHYTHLCCGTLYTPVLWCKVSCFSVVYLYTPQLQHPTIYFCKKKNWGKWSKISNLDLYQNDLKCACVLKFELGINIFIFFWIEFLQQPRILHMWI